MYRLIAFCLLAIPSISYSQSSTRWTGNWAGTLHTEKGDLNVIFKVSVRYNGWYTQMSVPSQGVYNQTMSATAIEKKNIQFNMDYPEASFSGKWLDSATIKGYWKQNEKSIPLTLHRVWGEWPVPKPQTPAKPYPWVSEEVRISVASGRIMIAGELDKPDSLGKFPVVVLISGSGPQDRDGSIGQHKPFLVLTQELISMGFAVLRCDDRGAGKTRGAMSALVSTTTEDQAKDVALFLNYLKSRNDIDTLHMGLLGHSEGGIIAPMVAASRHDVAFIVMLAGPAAGGLDANLYQNQLALQRAGLKPNEIKSFQNLHSQILKAIYSNPDTTGWRMKCDSLVKIWLATKPSKRLKHVVFRGKKQDFLEVQHTYESFLIPWWRFFITYQPSADLQKLNIPVLALNGEKDQQVECRSNTDSIRNWVPNVTVQCIPGLNHMFQNCTQCGIHESLAMDQTLSPALLEILRTWMAGLKP